MKIDKKVEIAVKRLLHKADFQSDVLSIREYYGIPVQGFPTDQQKDDWEENHFYTRDESEVSLDENVAVLVRKNGLSADWHGSLKRYVYLNDPHDMRLPLAVRVGVSKDDVTRKWRIIMYIAPEATQKDITNALPEVAVWKKRLLHKLPRQRTSQNEDLGQLAADLRLYGYKAGDTCDLFNGQMEEAFADQDIHTLIKNHRKLQGLS